MMDRNIIEVGGVKWIHDHGKAFGNFYNQLDTEEGKTNIQKAIRQLKKHKQRFRYTKVDFNGIEYLALFVQMSFCEIPSKFPEYISREDCARCPGNCTSHGIPVYSKRVNGRGRSIRVNSINEAILPEIYVSDRESVEPPAHINTRCSIYVRPDMTSIWDSDPNELINVERFDIELSDLFPSTINNVHVPHEIRQRVLHQIRDAIMSNHPSIFGEFENTDRTQSSMEGILRRTMETETTRIMRRRMRPSFNYTSETVRGSRNALNQLAEHVRTVRNAGITYDQLSESMRILGRATNSIYGATGQRLPSDPTSSELHPPNPPESIDDTHMVWFDRRTVSGYLYRAVPIVANNETVLEWKRVTMDDIRNTRPEALIRLLGTLITGEPDNIDVQSDPRHGGIDITVSIGSRQENVDFTINSGGIIYIQERSAHIRPERGSLEDLFG